jgi:hypothetical protein
LPTASGYLWTCSVACAGSGDVRSSVVPAALVGLRWKQKAATDTLPRPVFLTGNRVVGSGYVVAGQGVLPGTGVSVMMPTYDQAAYLPRAVASLLRQTFDNWKLVVIDDGYQTPPRMRLPGSAIRASATTGCLPTAGWGRRATPGLLWPGQRW